MAPEVIAIFLFAIFAYEYLTINYMANDFYRLPNGYVVRVELKGRSLCLSIEAGEDTILIQRSYKDSKKAANGKASLTGEVIEALFRPFFVAGLQEQGGCDVLDRQDAAEIDAMEHGYRRPRVSEVEAMSLSQLAEAMEQAAEHSDYIFAASLRDIIKERRCNQE